MALSKNFDVMMTRLETPACYGKYKVTSEENKKKCGTCWFWPKCKANKSLKKQEPKKSKK